MKKTFMLCLVAVAMLFASCEKEAGNVVPEKKQMTTSTITLSTVTASTGLKSGSYDRGDAPIYIDSVLIKVENWDEVNSVWGASEENWYTLAETGGDVIEITHPVGKNQFTATAYSYDNDAGDYLQYSNFTAPLVSTFDPLGSETINEHFRAYADAEILPKSIMHTGSIWEISAESVVSNLTISMETYSSVLDIGLFADCDQYCELVVLGNSYFNSTDTTVTNDNALRFTDAYSNSKLSLRLRVYEDISKETLLEEYLLDEINFNNTINGKYTNMVVKYDGFAIVPDPVTTSVLTLDWILLTEVDEIIVVE